MLRHPTPRRLLPVLLLVFAVACDRGQTPPGSPADSAGEAAEPDPEASSGRPNAPATPQAGDVLPSASPLSAQPGEEAEATAETSTPSPAGPTAAAEPPDQAAPTTADAPLPTPSAAPTPDTPAPPTPATPDTPAAPTPDTPAPPEPGPGSGPAAPTVPTSCAGIEAEYERLVSRSACESDADCQIVIGQCAHGLGGCSHAVSASVDQGVLDALGQAYREARCGGGACRCRPPPASAQCVAGACQAERAPSTERPATPDASPPRPARCPALACAPPQSRLGGPCLEVARDENGCPTCNCAD